MIKPIVSMNKMAMNESVATSCCFAEIVTSNNKVVYDVLYGGYLGSDLRQEHVWNSAINKSWKLLPYDVVGLNGASTISVTTDSDGKNVYIVDNNLKIGDWISATSGASQGKNCPHEDGYCSYITSDYILVDDQHIDSTGAHFSGGDSWAKPHKAKKHNS